MPICFTQAACSRSRRPASYIEIRASMAAFIPPAEAPVKTSTTKAPSRGPAASPTGSRPWLSTSSA